MINIEIINKMMHRAVMLSKNCTVSTYPNPKVGCVIFDNSGKIISEGFTQCYGSDHAEIMALKKINFYAENLSMAVTLEPCNHFGKTPPCSHAIIKSGIKNVFIAKKEENDKACNGGCYLSQNGVSVSFIDEFADIVENTNRFFFKNIRTGLPWITVKVAVSKDGYLTKSIGMPTKITNDLSDIYAHQLRASHMAIGVGAGTVNSDNPELTVRKVSGTNPQVVIFSADLSVNLNASVFSRKPIVITASRNTTALDKFKLKGIEIEYIQDNANLSEILEMLYKKRNLNSILIEGGANLIASFIQSGLVDEFLINSSREIFSSGLKLFEKEKQDLFLNYFKIYDEKFFETDHLRIYKKINNPDCWYKPSFS